MTTQAYYKDRLGFDPNDPREMTNLDPKLHGYEENLSKFKGIYHQVKRERKNNAAADAERLIPFIKKRLKGPPRNHLLRHLRIFSPLLMDRLFPFYFCYFFFALIRPLSTFVCAFDYHHT